ncbi:hypothetical protein [Streptomyces sp. NPDC002328]|uniref:hypothetical protein n=1 Tax=Streptomyces sp. NPDC002328 TaxID=3364642 RepID=UPI0036A1AE46
MAGEKDQADGRKKKGSQGGRPVTFDADFYRDRKQPIDHDVTRALTVVSGSLAMK